MSFKVIKNKGSYLLDNCDETILSKESDINDVISRCWENDVNKVLLYQKSLSDKFFDLKSGLAGVTLQKFANYNIILCLIIPKDYSLSDMFLELILENNKGNTFNVYKNLDDGQKWIESL